MATWREAKKEMRRTVHDAMQVRALYFAHAPPQTGDDEPLDVNVRIHTEMKALGDIQGQFGAERQEQIPRIVFDLVEVQPMRGWIVSVEAGEAYRIDNLLPPDLGYQTAEVSRLSAAQSAGLPVPEDA